MSAPDLVLPTGTGLVWLKTVDSTNEEARRRAMRGETGPLWIVAEAQTQGRGRRGRAWSAGAGNLTATHLSAPSLPADAAAQLSFAAALAVAEMLDLYAPGLARLKWPNDVLIRGRKIAGILLETATGPTRELIAWLAIGIGVNLARYPADTETPATSLAAEGVAPPRPDKALEGLAAALARWIEIHARDGFAPLRAAWLDRAPPLGTPIAARLGQGERRGHFAGLDAQGALLLSGADGQVTAITAGEVFFGGSPS